MNDESMKKLKKVIKMDVELRLIFMLLKPVIFACILLIIVHIRE